MTLPVPRPMNKALCVTVMVASPNTDGSVRTLARS